MEKTYTRADPRHPFVGLDNKNCANPRHYCCIHDIWLSEDDAVMRGCRTRSEGGECCQGFKENHFRSNIELLIRKTRPTKNKGSERYYNV